MIDLDPIPPYEAIALRSRLRLAADARKVLPIASDARFGPHTTSTIYDTLKIGWGTPPPALTSLLFPFFMGATPQPPYSGSWIPDAAFGFPTGSPIFHDAPASCQIRNVASMSEWFGPNYTGNVMALRGFALYAKQALIKFGQIKGYGYDTALATALAKGFDPPVGWTFGTGQTPDDFAYAPNLVSISEVAWSREMLRLYSAKTATNVNETSLLDTTSPSEDPLALTVASLAQGCSNLQIRTYPTFHGLAIVVSPSDLGQLLETALTSLAKATTYISLGGGGSGSHGPLYGQAGAAVKKTEAMSIAANNAHNADPSNKQKLDAALAVAAAYEAAVKWSYDPNNGALAAAFVSLYATAIAMPGVHPDDVAPPGAPQAGDACTLPSGATGKITFSGACEGLAPPGMGTATKVFLGLGAAGIVGLAAWKLGWLEKSR